MVFNLRTRNLRWQQHLDLSTDHTQYRAYIYSAPTLVDLNRDGKMEIIVGTSMVRPLACCCDFAACAGVLQTAHVVCSVSSVVDQCCQDITVLIQCVGVL